MKNRFDTKTKVAIFVFVISIAIIISSFVRFNSLFYQMQLSKQEEQLEDVAQNISLKVETVFDGLISSLQYVADVFSDVDFSQKEKFQDLLEYSHRLNEYDYTAVVDINGIGIDNNGSKIDIGKRDYFNKVMNGEVVVTEILSSYYGDGDEIQIIAVPLQGNDGTIRGAVIGVFYIDTLSELMERMNTIDVYSQIIDSDGIYISRNDGKDTLREHTSIWEDLEEYTFIEGSLEEIKTAMNHGESGKFRFLYGDEKRVSYYTKLGINNWYVFSTVNHTYIEDQIQDVNDLVLYISACLIAGFSLMLGASFWYYRKNRQELLRVHNEVVSSEEIMRIAIKESKQTIFEYNQNDQTICVRTDNPNFLWKKKGTYSVQFCIYENKKLDETSKHNIRKMLKDLKVHSTAETLIKVKDGNHIYWYSLRMRNLYDDEQKLINTIGILDDITEQKQQEERLKEKEQIQEVLIADALLYAKMDVNSEMIIEINGKKEELLYNQFLRETILSSIVQEKDKDMVVSHLSKESLVQMYQQGSDQIELQFMITLQEKVKWVSCLVYLMKQDANSMYALFMINDIDDKKREEIELKKKAECDDLTSLYNAATMKKLVNEFLNSTSALLGNHFIVLLDLDNFKAINDTFGHQMGDQVLQEVASTLSSTFRGDDLIARLGGDEFVVMLKHVKAYEVMLPLLESLCKKLHRTYTKDGESVTISASLGVAIAPKDGNTFEELYKKSDIALYRVKKATKNGVERY